VEGLGTLTLEGQTIVLTELQPAAARIYSLPWTQRTLRYAA
jgi:hypothetical protein